jgi:hypothetical protein
MDESQVDTERVTGQTDDSDVNEPKNMELFGESYMTSYAIRDGDALILDTYITQPVGFLLPLWILVKPSHEIVNSQGQSWAMATYTFLVGRDNESKVNEEM